MGVKKSTVWDHRRLVIQTVHSGIIGFIKAHQHIGILIDTDLG